MRNSTGTIEKEMPSGSFKVPEILSKEVVFADGYDNDNNDRVEEKLRELKQALKEAEDRHAKKDQEMADIFEKIKSVLWLKGAKERPDNAKQSLEFQKYQKALKELQDFEDQLQKKEEREEKGEKEAVKTNIKKVVEIIGDDKISSLILEIKNSKEQNSIPLALYGEVVSKIAKNLFENYDAKSFGELKEIKADGYRGLINNSKIVELALCGVDCTIDVENDKNMQKWTFELTKRILKFCGTE